MSSQFVIQGVTEPQIKILEVGGGVPLERGGRERRGEVIEHHARIIFQKKIHGESVAEIHDRLGVDLIGAYRHGSNMRAAYFLREGRDEREQGVHHGGRKELLRQLRACLRPACADRRKVSSCERAIERNVWILRKLRRRRIYQPIVIHQKTIRGGGRRR